MLNKFSYSNLEVISETLTLNASHEAFTSYQF